jgi:hypothetical protein
MTTILKQLKQAKSLGLIHEVAVWGDSIYISLNNTKDKNKLVTYFQKHNMPVEHLTKESILVLPNTIQDYVECSKVQKTS